MAMRRSGLFFTMDVGVRLGFARGEPGGVPRSGVVLLKKPAEDRSVALGNLIAFLNTTWTAEPPAFVAKEKPFHLGAFAKRGNAEHTVRLTYGLHAVIEGMCARFGIPHVEEYDQTVRKHFLGVAKVGTREETKAAVVQRARLLGYMEGEDDDRADALAVWDWACAHHGRRSPAKLFMFGEGAR